MDFKMELTTRSKIYLGFSILFAPVCFLFFNLALGIDGALSGFVILVVSVYVAIMTLVGFILSRFETSRRYRGDIGQLYHTIAVIVTTAGVLMSLILGAQGGYKPYLWAVVLAWSSLAVHLLIKRGSVKGIPKKNAFK